MEAGNWGAGVGSGQSPLAQQHGGGPGGQVPLACGLQRESSEKMKQPRKTGSQEAGPTVSVMGTQKRLHPSAGGQEGGSRPARGRLTEVQMPLGRLASG